MTAHVWNPPTLQAVTDYLTAACLPPDHVRAEIQKRDLTLVAPPSHACQYYSRIVSRYRSMSHGYHTEMIPMMGSEKIQHVIAYWHERPDDTTTRFSNFVDASGILFYKMSGDGRSVYVVAPYSETESGEGDPCRVFCIAFHHLNGDYFSRLKAHACGAALRVLTPVLRHYGITTTEDTAEYRIERSLEGVTATVNYDANQNGLLNEFIFGTSSPSLDYYARSVESFFSYLAQSPVMTPQALGLSQDATVYLGDRASLEDPVFYGFIGYVTSTVPIRQVVSRHTPAMAERAFTRAQSSSGLYIIGEAQNQAEMTLLRNVLTRRVTQVIDARGVDQDVRDKVLSLLSTNSLVGKKTVEMVGSGPRTFEAFVDKLLSLTIAKEAQKVEDKPARKKRVATTPQTVLDTIVVDDTHESAEDAGEAVDDIPF